MSTAMMVLASLLFLVLFVPWLVVVTSPAFVAGGAAGSVVAAGARRLGTLFGAPAPSRRGAGVLCVDGIADRRLRASLETEMGRVLDLAPSATQPRACACVKATSGGAVGVLRVFNRKGHYAVRAAGTSPDAAGTLLLLDLERFRTTFPAKVGAARQRIDECVPESCPLRARRRELVRAAA